jgi:hypothetical protein
MQEKTQEEFICYIDESGDEGFKKSSSKCFGFAAVLIRKSNDSILPKKQKEILKIVSQNKINPLKQIHYKDFNHEKRKFIANFIEQQKIPIRAILCASVKDTIFAKLKLDFDKNKYKYFNYILRHLLERISWVVRDDKSKNKKLKIIFSNRKQMKLDVVKRYIELLKNDQSCKICWEVLDQAEIIVRNHNQLAGLQFADIFATGFRKYFLEKDEFNNVETSYIKTLKNSIYSYKNKYQNYGIKIRELNWSNLHKDTKESLISDFSFIASP